MSRIQEHKLGAGLAFTPNSSFDRPSGEGQPRDLDRAIRLLEEALERPVDDADDWNVEGRLEYLRR